MALSEKRKLLLARRDQGDGGILPKPEPDRSNRVLNYDGLRYFYEKLKTDGKIGSGTSSHSGDLHASDIKLNDVMISIDSWTLNESVTAYINIRQLGLWSAIDDQNHYGARSVTEEEWNSLPDEEKGVDEYETGYYQIKKGYIWVVEGRDVYWWLDSTFDTSGFEADERYKLVFCNSGDIPPSGYTTAQQTAIDAYAETWVEGSEWALVLNIDAGTARIPTNRKFVEYKETHYAFDVQSDSHVVSIMPRDKWYQKNYADPDFPADPIYAVFRKGDPVIYDPNASQSYWCWRGYNPREYIIDRRRGASGQKTGTPEHNKIFMDAGSALQYLLNK